VINCKLDPSNVYYLFGDAGVSWDAFALVCAHPEWIDAKDAADDGGILLAEKPPIISGRSGRFEPVPDGVLWPEDLGTFVVPNVGFQEFPEQQNISRSGRVLPYGSNMGPNGDRMLCTVIDFALRIVPTQARDVWFNSIIDLVQTLSQRIRIGSVWFDHWGSHATLQQIRDMGVSSDQLTLRAEHFMGFLRMAYNGRVKMLPPKDSDHISLTKTGALVLGTAQETMSGETVALVELMRLSRSADLKRFINPLKGTIRGRDSDDVARCIIGAHYIVQDTVVDELANTKKKRAIRKRQIAVDNSDSGQIVRVSREW
jgi:hypothetical protein